MSYWVNTLGAVYAKEVQTHIVSDLDAFVVPKLEHPPTAIKKDEQELWNFASIPPDLRSKTDHDRTALNASLEKTSVLALDYDGGYLSPEAFRERFSGFTYYQHTSFNHSQEIPKFRVLMPIETTLSKGQLKALRTSNLAVELFGSVDRSCFEISRYFYLPVKNESKPDVYEYHVNKGTLYSFPQDVLYQLEFISISNSKKPQDGQREKTKPTKYVEAALTNIGKRILEANINRRGEGRGMNKRIYGLFKQLYEVLGSVEEARTHLLQYASNPVTIGDIRNCQT